MSFCRAEGHSQPVMALLGDSRGLNRPTLLSACPPYSGWCLPLAEPGQKPEGKGDGAGVEKDGERVRGGQWQTLPTGHSKAEACMGQSSGQGGRPALWFCGQRKVNCSCNDEIEVGNVL